MLRRILIGLAVAVAAAAGFVGYRAYRFFHTETVKLDDRFYVVLGGGGNTAILIADDGVLVVDTKFLRPGHALAAQIKELTDKPVKVIINTHYHADHTHGNPNYARGTEVIAHRHTRQHLLTLDKDYWESEPNWSLLPGDLLDDERELHFGDETIRLLHPGRGHTDGDIVVHFTRRGIVHTGDLFLHDMYPLIDHAGGGNAHEWPASLDKVLALTDVHTYIPGHGALSTRQDVERFREYLGSLVAQVDAQVAAGQSLAQLTPRIDLHGFAFQGIPFRTSQARNIALVYEETTGKKK